MHREGIYLISDIKEVIRLALVGAGTAPVAALRLVERPIPRQCLLMAETVFGN